MSLLRNVNSLFNVELFLLNQGSPGPTGESGPAGPPGKRVSAALHCLTPILVKMLKSCLIYFTLFFK